MGSRENRTEPCQHFKAERTAAPTEGRQLPDGHWQYREQFHCPDCGKVFTEIHDQTVTR